MKQLFLPLLASAFFTAVEAGGIGYPHLGAMRYCEALTVAVKEAWSDSVESHGPMRTFNRNKMASLIAERCSALWDAD